MDKALEIGKSSTTGGFYLLIGVAGSTIIMALGTIVLASLLSPNDVGLYGMALIPSSLIGYFRDWGVNSALTQHIASLRAAGKDSEIHDVMYSGIIFEIITGVILSLVCFGVAEPLAYLLSPSNAGNLTIYISIMSLSIFAGALINAASGIFIGFERMKLNSFTQILQAVVKTALGPLLIVIGFGVLGAIYAALFSFVLGGAIAMALVYFALYRTLHKCKVGKCDVTKTLKPMLSYGLPLTVSTTITGVLTQVFAFTMALYAGTVIMGNYYVSAYFVVLLTFISTPVSYALFPTFSKLNPEKDPELVKTVFSSAVKYTSMLMAPATLLLVTLSTPLINTIFPKAGFFHSLFIVDAAPKYPYASLFLSLAVLVNLLILVGNVTVSSFQNGIKKTRQVMKQSLVSLVVGFLLAYFFVGYLTSIGGPSYAVVAGIIGTLVATIPSLAWALYWSWRNYKVKPDFQISAKLLAASGFAAVLAYLFIVMFRLPYLLTLVGGFAVFSVAYLSAAPLIGAINQTDIQNLKAMMSGLGLISKIIALPLLFMQKLCQPKKSNLEKIAVHKIEQTRN